MNLNDGTHTFTSYSYKTSAALDIAITSSELFLQCSWRVLNTIDSDHFPVLICLKRRQKVQIKQNNFWNFKKANWDSYMDSVDQNLTSNPFTNDLEDSRTTNSKLWRIVKKINKEQEQCEESNSVIDTNGQVFPDDKAAANGLTVYYQETSKLVFTSEDKSVMKRAKDIIHGCRTSDVGDQGLSRDFSQ
ncbi:uncharacterized protein TNCV_4786901 [Trichonephila clavipes]|nr:uncharacterized protein TNCV_4786901 [Trichonephila clavipes]